MTITVRTHDHSARIAMSGRFDFQVHRNFKDAYMPLLGDAGLHEIEIEMSKLDYIDSSALGMLVLLNDRAKEVNISVALLNASDAVSQLLEVANFSQIFSIRRAASFNTEGSKNRGAKHWVDLPKTHN